MTCQKSPADSEIVYTFRFPHGIDMRALRSQRDDLLLLVEGQTPIDDTSIDCVINVLEVMLDLAGWAHCDRE